jgi:uncharacterized protein (DUF362 family)
MKPSALNRRDFLKLGLVTGSTVAVSGLDLFAAEPGKVDVWVIHGSDPAVMMRKALAVISENGGFGENVKTLALKVNAAWARKPEEGANTHPVLVSEFIKGCRESGVENVIVPELPCDQSSKAFVMSGIADAVKDAGGKMIDLSSTRKSFTEVTIPGGKKLKTSKVAREFLDADCIVNMPVAKHHGGAGLTIAMKNWMGAAEERKSWHTNDMPQCIADFSTFIKPRWTIVDATRIMVDKGPKGPGQLKHPNLLVVSRDQVAADAYVCAKIFEWPLERAPYIEIAAAMKIGVADLDGMSVHSMEA